MQLRILKSAFGDLDRGRAFYAQHGDELGDYFLDSLFADIDSLARYGGIHVPTTKLRATFAPCGASWTAAASRVVYDRL